MANCEKCIKSDVCKHYEPGSTSACEHYAEPIRKGYWIWKSNYRDYDGDICSTYSCSNCGKVTSDESLYCPNCGAEMK